MERIERVLKDKTKREFEKWYSIWDILLPGVPPPTTPWNEPLTEAPPPIPDLETFMSNLETIVASTPQNEALRQDASVRQLLMNAARQAFVEATTSVPLPIQTQIGLEDVPPSQSQHRVAADGEQDQETHEKENPSEDQLAGRVLDNNGFAGPASEGIKLSRLTAQSPVQDLPATVLTQSSSGGEERALEAMADPGNSLPFAGPSPQNIVSEPSQLNDEPLQLEDDISNWLDNDGSMDVYPSRALEVEFSPFEFADFGEMGTFSDLDFGEQEAFTDEGITPFVEFLDTEIYDGLAETTMSNRDRNMRLDHRGFDEKEL